MGLAAWCWAPWFVGVHAPSDAWARALIGSLTVGLVWQCVLVVALVRRECGNLRWATLKDALWLHRPQTHRGVGFLVVICLGLALLMGLAGEWLSLPAQANHDLGHFLQSPQGRAFFKGNWLWFGVALVLMFFNTVAGEELLFRGLLLPRMHGAFGRLDWLANGLLFALYHLHQPWSMPAAALDAFLLAWPSKRLRSAWIGIAVHSSQSVFLTLVLLWLVL